MKRLGWIAAVVVLGVAMLVWNKRRILAEDEQRSAMDRTAARMYDEIRDLVPPDDAGLLPEPSFVEGKILPVTSGVSRMELDGWLYARLPEGIRARDESDARTVVVVATNASSVYVASGDVPRGMISDVTLTLIDIARHAVTGQKRFRKDPPPYHATDAELDAYSDQFWAPVASYLGALPRR